MIKDPPPTHPSGNALDAIREAFAKLQELTPAPRYFLCSERTFNQFLHEARISHTEVSFIQIGPKFHYRKLSNGMRFLVNGVTDGAFKDGMVYEVSPEFARTVLKHGEYNPDTGKWTEKELD
jgi:hypothetical protein